MVRDGGSGGDDDNKVDQMTETKTKIHFVATFRQPVVTYRENARAQLTAVCVLCDCSNIDTSY